MIIYDSFGFFIKVFIIEVDISSCDHSYDRDWRHDDRGHHHNDSDHRRDDKPEGSRGRHNRHRRPDNSVHAVIAHAKHSYTLTTPSSWMVHVLFIKAPNIPWGSVRP